MIGERQKVFIATDLVMDRALSETATALEADGFDVVRGPMSLPGVKTEFAASEYDRYFAGTDVIVVSTRSVLSQQVLDACDRLRAIVFPSIGTEAIDLAQMTERNVLVANGATPENFMSMSEATVLLVLQLFYRLQETEAILRQNKPRPQTMHARMIRGKTIGLIGLGRIARGVAERLRGWGVEILAYDPFVKSSDLARSVELDELLRRSDVVSIHTTLTPDTRHLIGEAELRKMKHGAALINVSRGLCVDEAAVAQALQEGRLGAAALDAFAVEPLPTDSALRSAPNAILTPHMVGHTQELFDSFTPACIDNVRALLAGDIPPYVCNPNVTARWQSAYGRSA
jgi:phosphoglycerate dehydrogenase-like enzyme